MKRDTTECESLKQLITIYEAIEESTQSVLDNIQSTLDTYPILATDPTYSQIYNTIIGYQTTFTAKLATYKSTREGYQTDYNTSCGTTGGTTPTVGTGTNAALDLSSMTGGTMGEEKSTTPYTLTTTQAGSVVTSRPKSSTT